MRLTLLVLTFILLTQNAFAAPLLQRGVALHGPMTWPDRAENDKGEYEFILPLYSAARFNVPTRLLAKVKEAGFDFIRLSIDPAPFIALSGKDRKALDKRLKDVIATIRSQQLDVIVDLHPINRINYYHHAVIESSRRFPDYVRTVKDIARLLASEDMNHVALEPLNEPQSGYQNASDWQEKADALYKAIRSEAPDITIIMTGGKGGSAEGLLALDPSAFDKNVLYSFHYYLPYVFTHQGVEVSKDNPATWPRRFISELPYPPAPDGLIPFYQQFETKLNGATDLTQKEKSRIAALGKEQLTQYFAQPFPQRIQNDFRRVAEWAEKHNIAPERIFLGEFGATQAGERITGAASADRVRWITDVRQAAEANQFRWSFWALCCAKESHGMVLVSLKDANKLDQETLKALGME